MQLDTEEQQARESVSGVSCICSEHNIFQWVLKVSGITIFLLFLKSMALLVRIVTVGLDQKVIHRCITHCIARADQKKVGSGSASETAIS